MKNLAKIAVCTLVYLVVFDIAGALVSLFFEIVPLLGVSSALFYAIWFVAAVFCGFLIYNSAGSLISPAIAPNGQNRIQDWSEREDSGRTGLLVVLTTTAILAALSFAALRLSGWNEVEPSHYVPDSGPLTLTFLITVFLSMILAHKSLRPAAKKTTQNS
jgi:hypothetical protein